MLEALVEEVDEGDLFGESPYTLPKANADQESVGLGSRPSDPAVDPDRPYIYRDKKKKGSTGVTWLDKSPLAPAKAPLGPSALRGSPKKPKGMPPRAPRVYSG